MKKFLELELFLGKGGWACPLASFGVRMRDDFLALAVDAWDEAARGASLFACPVVEPRPPRLRTWRALAHLNGVVPDAECSLAVLTGQSAFGGLARLRAWISSLLAKRLRQGAPGHALLLTSWNVNSLRSLHSERAHEKLSLIRRWLKEGIVCLQETHFEGVQAGRLAQMLTGVSVVDSPAVATGQGGTSGGVAVIVPSFPGWRLVEQHILVPGMAVAVKVLKGGHASWVVNVYLPPARRAAILGQLLAAVKTTWPHGLGNADCWVCGDLNSTRAEDGAALTGLGDLLCDLGCVELPVVTRRPRDIDRVFRPARAFEEHTVAWEAYALPGGDVHAPVPGHSGTPALTRGGLSCNPFESVLLGQGIYP